MRDQVIYDLGMNNGDDIQYYLKKGFKVVGIEANPDLIKKCTQRFQKDIVSKNLVIENIAVAIGEASPSIEFYIHKTSHVLSTLVRPMDIENYHSINIPHKPIGQIIDEHGSPYYLKIDIEHYDAKVLKDLLNTTHRPQFISAESHDLDVFATLCLLDYKYFNLVHGGTVSTFYRNANIKTQSSSEIYSFPNHSSGPFGEDISTPWMKKEVFVKYLARQGLGWKDIHATSSLPEKATYIESLNDLRENLGQIKSAVRPLLNLVPSVIRRCREKVNLLNTKSKRSNH